jgi:MFS family permease
MLRSIRDKNIWLVYATIFVVGAAYGISISLLAHHLDASGYSKSQMGSLASWFAFGIVAAALPAGALVQRVSAKTALVLCLGGYAACVTAFPYMGSFAGLALVRFLDGAFSVGVWVSCETVLLARADRGMKAYVTSLYAMAIAVGYVVGPVAARGIVAIAPIRVAFAVAGALALAALAVVALFLDADAARPAPGSEVFARASEEPPPHAAAAPTLALFVRIKTSCFATFAYGYFQASVVLFLPLYLMRDKGIARGQTIVIPAFFAAGMLLFSNVAGRLGDRFGHLLVMRVLGAVGMVMVLGFVFLDAYVPMCVAVFVAGATLASISPVSLALQGVVTEPRSLSRSNGIYNACYAAGMLLGPKASSLLFERFGGGAMLYHLAALWAVFVVFCAVFHRDDPAAALPRSERGLGYGSLSA